MTLAALELPTCTIKVGKGDFTVRGLSFEDVAALIHEHRADVDRVVELFKSSKDSDGALAATLVRELPVLTAKAIARAADEPAMHEKVRRLPVPTQLEAIQAIGRLTFEETGGVKKFAEQLVGLLGATNDTIHALLSSNSTRSE